MSSPADVKAEVRQQLKNALRGVRADIRELKSNDKKQSEAIEALQTETKAQTKTLAEILGVAKGTKTLLKIAALVLAVAVPIVELYRAFR